VSRSSPGLTHAAAGVGVLSAWIRHGPAHMHSPRPTRAVRTTRSPEPRLPDGNRPRVSGLLAAPVALAHLNDLLCQSAHLILALRDCVETRTAGRARGPGKRAGSNPDTAPRAYLSGGPAPLETLVAGRRPLIGPSGARSTRSSIEPNWLIVNSRSSASAWLTPR